MEDYDNRFACYDILEEYPQDESERHIFMGMGSIATFAVVRPILHLGICRIFAVERAANIR